MWCILKPFFIGQIPSQGRVGNPQNSVPRLLVTVFLSAVFKELCSRELVAPPLNGSWWVHRNPTSSGFVLLAYPLESGHMRRNNPDLIGRWETFTASDL
jgi:hypothetical protein